MLDKYGLIGNKVNELSDEAKTEVLAALKRAENKITVSTILSHWREIVIFALVILFLFSWIRMNGAVKELSTKNETFNRLQKIDAIDTSLKSVTENQKNLYPQMDSMINQLDSARAQLQKLNSNMKTLTQVQARAIAEKLDIEELSADLNSLGYPNKVIKETAK